MVSFLSEVDISLYRKCWMSWPSVDLALLWCDGLCNHEAVTDPDTRSFRSLLLTQSKPKQTFARRNCNNGLAKRQTMDNIVPLTLMYFLEQTFWTLLWMIELTVHWFEATQDHRLSSYVTVHCNSLKGLQAVIQGRTLRIWLCSSILHVITFALCYSTKCMDDINTMTSTW